ncbi:type II toxin-antitoxin system antitoxin SocA domain-containing protein [Cronbergia sp. UHCC 0137]|uniref:Panacea domain-containing protein n=1 Tax=Cronbergia sp. UHCC 0137 TaxID=3110239 RepID=UPI002B2069F9|nr:type II toxin-antitoxin system antitoxin SocA domain-containing protein [Cronbergia sp. UHCC 0137]MEA5619687.1 type II toxin-antitoxin system antitoxin SocA domain-containing protein [Cronbergia sp. UHCC 0137]
MISENLKKVVNSILVRHRELFQESLSPMKLQKLCYYVQAIYMATHDGETLFQEDFEAWTYGPVIPDLYHEFKQYGWKSIEDEVEVPEIEQEIEEFIELIVEAYGRYDGAALITMTHREEPWLDARKGLPEMEGSNAVISKESMKRFFKKRLNPYMEITSV